MKQLKKEYREKSGLELAALCTKIALDAKAEDPVVLDVRGKASFTDYFIILSGRSTRHVQGIAESIEGALSAKRVSATSAEGLQEGQWVLLDFNDVVVHVFYHEQRKFFDLEGLWHNADRLDIDELIEE